MNQQLQPGTPWEGIWLSGQELDGFARTALQTIDGEFQAFPAHLDPQSIAVEELQAFFPRSRAELVVRIIDGGIFFVHVKHSKDVARLRAHFADVRLEDTSRHF